MNAPGTSAVIGAAREYSPAVLESMVGAVRGRFDAVDFLEQKGIGLAALHRAGDPNVAAGKDGMVWAAVAGNVVTRAERGVGATWGPLAVADEWARKGQTVVDRTDGAFVCIVYDARTGDISAFNDFIGQVPLYYARLRGGVYFASMLAPFLLTESLSTGISSRGLDLYLSFGCVPGSESILAGVRKLLPGSVASIGNRGIQGVKRWRIGGTKPDYSSSTEDFVDEIFDALNASVRVSLADSRRNLGIFLGGLDSSLVAALMRRNSSERLTALTASFEDPRFNERAVGEVSNTFGLELREIRLEPDEIPQVVEDMALGFDEPVSDMIASPVAFALARKTPTEIETIYDGTGADDLFQGIPHPGNGRRLDGALNLIPYAFRSGVRSGARAVLRRQGGWYAASAFAPLLSLPLESEFESWRVMPEETVHTLLGLGPKRPCCETVQAMIRDVAADMRGMPRDPANISVKTAVSMYFGPTHGFDCSRNRALASMYGFRVVSPYYDRAVYDVGLSVPWYLKTPVDGVSKPLLRLLAVKKRLLPREVAMLGKMGLGSSRRGLADAQMRAWASRELAGWMRMSLRENLPLVGHLLGREGAEKALLDGQDRAFQLLMFALWYRAYFGGRTVQLFRG